ncbi:MAG: GNAT family N-acetyltransferase [Candidatus Levyibacteriota bacterium]
MGGAEYSRHLQGLPQKQKTRRGISFAGFFRGRQKDTQDSTSIDSARRNGDLPGRRRPLESSRRLEEETPPDVVRPIELRDLDTMIENGWFEDPDTVLAFKGDVINNTTVPKAWTDETRQEFKENVLKPFYFPDGPIHVVADEGKLIRETDVNRRSWVLEWKGKVVAARSFIDQDPWASEADFNKWKAGHFQMLVVDPAERDSGFGLRLVAQTHDEVVAEGFQRLITWVNVGLNTSIRHSITERFFKSLGYREDRRWTGLRKINVPGGEVVESRGYMLTPKKKEENYADPELNPWVRWGKKKLARELQDRRMQSSK